MAASGWLGTKAVIALDIGFGFKAQDQGLRRVPSHAWKHALPVAWQACLHAEKGAMDVRAAG